MTGSWRILGGVFLAGLPALAGAAELPAHQPLRILVVSDEVNPHGLSDAELTQPGDLSAAIGNPDSGISVAQIDEVSSQCVDDALAALAVPGAVDVIVYFSHLAALGCDGNPRQVELTASFDRHLQDGGGVVVFHHGMFEAAGKEAILELLGARGSSVEWDTTAGQDVIAVAPQHFVASNGVEYPAMRSFQGAGVTAGEYPFFNNTPDESYQSFGLLTTPGESRTLLFVSATADGGAPRVLGYDLHRPGWMGHVVYYQPGEYQPQALDDRQGNNFQILANAIYYAATTQEEGGGDTDGSTGETEDDTGPTGEAGDDPATTDAGESTGGSSSSADEGGGGCGCQVPGAPRGLPWLLVLGGLGLTRRRRAPACAR